MSWVCLKERGLCVIGVRNAFGSCQRDGCDVTAARRSYYKFATRAKNNENHNQKPKESIVHGSQKRHIRM